MAAILYEITNMTTKARAKLETWRLRPVRNYNHSRHYNDVISMASIICYFEFILKICQWFKNAFWQIDK